ncbi:ABC transporter ATP-binding protein [Bifidobacterium thermophilum]|uniref:ABC transporter ATP-binding protein n=1 Tax=Bifidobacterium thermophilum TaxID=33905 RepID=UPI0030A3CA62
MYVEITNLTKTIKGKPVLRDVTAGFERGTIYGIVGPNGSGKTMLLRAICGFIRPDTGTVSIGGKPVEFNRKLPESVGVIIENPGFILAQSAMDNLRYLADINHAFDEQETMRLLTVFGLQNHANEKVKSYSLGMRQKLAIVQALMEHQPLIALDEPTNGLDEHSVAMFLEEMRHQRSLGHTVIIASHHSDELHQIADCLYTMADGVLSTRQTKEV